MASLQIAKRRVGAFLGRQHDLVVTSHTAAPRRGGRSVKSAKCLDADHIQHIDKTPRLSHSDVFRQDVKIIPNLESLQPPPGKTR